MVSRGTVNPANKNGKGQRGREGVVVRTTPRLVPNLNSYQGEKNRLHAVKKQAITSLFQYQENISSLDQCR